MCFVPFWSAIDQPGCLEPEKERSRQRTLRLEGCTERVLPRGLQKVYKVPIDCTPGHRAPPYTPVLKSVGDDTDPLPL